jgi:hypothetical protein
VTVLAVIGVLLSNVLLSERLSAPAVALGVLVTATAPGHVSNTGVGTRVGRWFRDVGPAGRAVAVVTFAAGVRLVTGHGYPSAGVLDGTATGVVLAVVVYVVAFLLEAGSVSGWRPASR